MDGVVTEVPVLKKINIKGIVQGVGFRPFIYRLATKYQLKGWIINTSSGVELEVEGTPSNLKKFLASLRLEAPPISRIESLVTEDGEARGYHAFEIRESRKDYGYQLISPDIALCSDCLRELFDPIDRRYRYPFINCTNCGPRFTIIKDIPYDRASTTMSSFPMCPTCQEEFDNPLNRRFHAQPNACPTCGPHLFLTTTDGKKINTEEPVIETSNFLKKGYIVAIKGLGGFHLACDAQNGKTVKLLRERKRRPYKPFALMMIDLPQVEKHCYVNEEERKLLTTPQVPIVLLRKRENSPVAQSVTPNNNYLGVMLPYTPIHHLLMSEFEEPLIMTSGNLSEEPIAYENEEALERLKDLADFFLFHNRDIYTCYDDSVYTVFEDQPYPVRRARSYAPSPVKVNLKEDKIVLACGADLKNTFCFIKDGYAFLSQHNGDLEDYRTFTHFKNNVEIYQRLFRLKPEVIAYDLHPDYFSTQYALRFKDELPLIGIQHHHAHIASCMAEHDLDETVIGVALDGLGYGTDGQLWGGEFMLVDYKGYERIGHLEYLSVPGGDLAGRKPYRLAYSYMKKLLGFIPDDLPVFNRISPEETQLLKIQIEMGINTPLTSSCGRLFDAVSSLLDICQEVTYESQAAVELEMISEKGNVDDNTSYPFTINPSPPTLSVSTPYSTPSPMRGREVLGDEPKYLFNLKDLFQAIYDDIENGVPPSDIGLKFHNTLAFMILSMSRLIRKETGINKVVLSGGCFQNRLLLQKSLNLLRKDRFEPFFHRQVPTNDGGLSLGQAVIANVLSNSSLY